MARLLGLFTLALLTLTSPVEAAVRPLSDSLGALPFGALAPLTAAGHLLVIEEGPRGLVQVTVLTTVDLDADEALEVIADPLTHRDMSPSVADIRMLPPDGDKQRFEVEIETPGLNAHLVQTMAREPGRTLRIQSRGDLVGEHVWRFTPLGPGRTGVEYSLFADLMSMGAFTRWMSHQAPSVQTGSNAVAGIVTVAGLQRLAETRGGRPAPSADTSPRPLPALGPLLAGGTLGPALVKLASRGTVAWVGPGETVLLTAHAEELGAARARITAAGGRYDLQLQTPFKAYDVVVEQSAGATAFQEVIVEGSPLPLAWSVHLDALPGGRTLTSMRSTVDLSESLLLRIAMSMDPYVGPALRLATLLSPFSRVKP